MPEYAAIRLQDTAVDMADDLEREFEMLMVESSTLAFRVAFGVLRRREDAEDVAQEAFIRAHRSFRQLRDRARFRAWLVRMTFRLALNRRRSDTRRTVREAMPVVVAPVPSGADHVEADERATQLWAAIDALPDKLRAAIILSGIEGHDVQAVAVLLGVPAGTVKSRLFVARQRIKERLQWTITASNR